MARRPKKGSSTPSQSDGPVNLELLYFGKDDAESDFARGGLLKQGFMRTRAYEEALHGSKTLIVGRKGSGKSAICLMLRDTLSPTGRCALITPDEISADEIRRFHLVGIPVEQSKQLIWRYVFDIQIAKFLIAASKETTGNAAELRKDLDCLKAFLRDNKETEDLPVMDRFWKIVERLKGAISVEAFSVKMKLDGELQAPSAGAKAHDNLDIVERRLLRVASLLGLTSSSISFHLLVDQIEKVWSNDRESDAMVVGLLLAAKATQALFNFVVCTIFIRTDIYEQLQFQDRDKLRGDEFHIDWDENSLVDLIQTRAEASLGSQISPQRFWSQLFPPVYEGAPSDKYLVSRTLMRPRDIIQLCNACRDIARNSRHPSIEAEDIRKALKLYSNWKLNDLQNEWSVNYPFLPDAFLMLSNSSYMPARWLIEDALRQVKADLTARYPNLAHALTPQTFLSILYSVGLIGVVRNGITQYSFGKSEEDEIKASDNEFVIHPCFRNALQSTSAIKLAPYEPESQRIRLTNIGQIRAGATFRGNQTIRSHRNYRAIDYTSYMLDQLPKTVASSSLPEEIRSEILGNLAAMMGELRNADQLDLPMAQAVLTRVYRHVRELYERLEEGQWLGKDKNLNYTLNEAIEDLERFLYRGDTGEFQHFA